MMIKWKLQNFMLILLHVVATTSMRHEELSNEYNSNEQADSVAVLKRKFEQIEKFMGCKGVAT